MLFPTQEQCEKTEKALEEVKKEFKITFKPILVTTSKFFERFEWLWWLIIFDILFIICVDIYITFLI